MVGPGYRHVMTTAAAVASLEALAPGRVAVGVGPAHSQHAMGRPATPWSEVADFIRTLRTLLRGEEVVLDGAAMRMLQPDDLVVERPLSVPILVPAEGPRGEAVARDLADGVFSFARPLSESRWSVMMVHGTVIEDGDDPDRLMAALGAGAGSRYHITYDFAGRAVDALPGGAEYRAAIEGYSPDRRHFTLWARHLTDATVEERAVLTPELARDLTLTGPAEVVGERLAALATGGLTEVVYQPAGPDIERELSSFAEAAGLAG
jgi:5,10-methylenetetrahydromethanopterin reductase